MAQISNVYCYGQIEAGGCLAICFIFGENSSWRSYKHVAYKHRVYLKLISNC